MGHLRKCLADVSS